MARFHTLKVKDIKRETADAVSVAFEIPPQQQPEYQFKQGQYITLKMSIGGEEIRRSSSIESIRSAVRPNRNNSLCSLRPAALKTETLS